MEPIYSLQKVNLAFLVIGLAGLWFTTHDFLALFWGLVASVHVTIRFIDPDKKEDGK